MNPRSLHRTTRPRKTPSQARSAETVAAIVEAAAQVLETDGFPGFNTNAVARRAGVSIGSVYQYFPGKDALTVALIQRETARFLADAAAALDARSGRTALTRLIGAAVRQQLQRPVLARLLDLEEGRLASRGELPKSELENLFAAAIERAAPTHAQPDVAAADVTAIVHGMVDAAGQRDESDVDSLERRVQAAVFGYLSRTRPRQAPAKQR